MEIQKKLKIFGKTLFYIIFVAVFLLVIGMMISKFSNRVFFLGNRAILWVVTDSIEEEIPTQSYIQIRKSDASQVKVGDVITFYSDDPVLQGHLNTHRVVEIADDGKAFITKGDNNVTCDKYPAKADSVVGIYEKNMPLMTKVGRIFQSKIGLFCILIFTALMVVFTFFFEPIKQLFKKESKDSLVDEQK